MAYNITQYLEKCTSNAPSTANYADVITITITADSGCVFETTPTTGSYQNSDGDWVNTTFTLSNNNTIAVAKIDVGSNISITATAVSKVTGVEIRKQLTNCTTDVPDTITGKTPFTTTVTANAGYEFENTPYYQWQNSDGNYVNEPLNLNATKTIATKTFMSPPVSETSNMSLYGTAIEVKTGLPVAQRLTNCKSNIGATIEFNTEFSTIVTADSGCVFKEAPQYSWKDTDSNYQTVTLELSNNDTVAMCTFVSPSEQDYESGFSLYANAKVDVPYINKYGSINVYNVTNEELESFSKQRYAVSSGGGATKYDDLGQFIVKLHRVYCGIGDTKPALIQAAYHDTLVQSRTPLNDIFIVDFGSIQVPKPNNDIVDYDSEISLFLPFKGFVVLNTPELLGKPMRLIYIVNIVSGDCVANIEVDNIVVHSETLKLITEVFFRTYDTPSYFSVDYNVNALAGFIPYLVIKHYNSKMVQLYNNNERRVIGEFAGYHEFTNIVNIDALNATNEEIDLIINNLQKGIIL